MGTRSTGAFQGSTAGGLWERATRQGKDTTTDTHAKARRPALLLGVTLWVLGMAGLPWTATANMIVNGGFDADSPPLQVVAGWIWTSAAPAGWTLEPAADGTSSFFVSPMPLLGAHTAPNSANFGAIGITEDHLSQVLPTQAGQTYRLEFFLAHSSTNDANAFHVRWNGDPVFALVNAAAFPYTEHLVSVVATGPFTTLEFAGREGPAAYGLDDVSVTAAAVPEPATGLLLATGVGVLACGWWRRQRAGERLDPPPRRCGAQSGEGRQGVSHETSS